MRTLVASFKYAFLSVFALFICFPIVWLGITSLKSNQELFSTGLPEKVTLDNFRNVIDEYNLVHYFMNSFLIAVSTTVAIAAIAALAAYALAKYKFPGSAAVLSFIVSLRMVPNLTLFIPLYLMFSALHMLDSYTSIILASVAAGLPFAIWVLYSFFVNLPGELMEASLIDGCNRYQTLFRVSFPLATPGIAVISILSFISTWNEFLLVLVTTQTNNVQTVPIALAQMTLQYGIRWDMMSAAGMLYIIPTLIMTFVVQKYIVQGLTMGAVKG